MRKIVADFCKKIVVTLILCSLVFSPWVDVPFLGSLLKVEKAEAALATLEYVGGNSATGNSANYNVSLTALTGGSAAAAAEGDLVIVSTGWAGTADGNPGVSTSGFTEVADLFADDTTDANLSVNYKIMSASPDTTVTCLGSGSATNGAVCVVHVWRYVNTSTPLDVTSVTATAINAEIPNGGSITPVTSGAVVLVTGLGAGTTQDAAVTAPTGYSNQVMTNVDPGNAPVIAIASKAWSSGAEDPAAWTGWTQNTTASSWAAVTLALRPMTLPVAPTFYNNDGGTAQIAFNNIKQSTTTPKFRVSTTHSIAMNRFQVQMSTSSTFAGNVYAQTFSSTYTSGTEYTLFANALSPSLPTTDGATYYVRARASSNAGAQYGDWSTNTQTFTYQSSGNPNWFQTVDGQFSLGTLTRTQTTGSGGVNLTGSSNIVATGGSTSTTGIYTVHTFTSDGTFQVTSGSGNVQALVVGGGGGGGPSDTVTRSGGGGGAGGVTYNPSVAVTAQSYSIDIGNGGNGSVGTIAGTEVGTVRNGSSSSALGITAVGGGGGGNGGAGDGANGGSGGGSGRNETAVFGTGTAGQGNSGAIGGTGSTAAEGGGGGGGAGTAGSAGTSAVGGAGGNGTTSAISGSSVTYGGGGGGSRFNGSSGSGGSGGGGAGGTNAAGTAGTANRGGGGGGGSGTVGSGGNGGTGIVIIRYDSAAAGGNIVSPEINFSNVIGAYYWGTTTFSTTETNGDIKLQVYHTVSTACDTIIPDGDLSGNSSGFDVSSSPISLRNLSTTTYDTICLKANLTYSGGSPTLNDWGVSWSFDPKKPTVTTDAASSVTVSGATLNGNITNVGGQAASKRGFATSTSATLTSGVATTTVNGTFGTGAFTMSPGGLNANTTYYFRAFAYNTAGTSTGIIRSFLTLPGTPGTPTFSSVTPTTMSVNWTAPSGGASTYKVERCSGAGCSSWTEITSGLVAITYGDSSLSANTLYRYRIRATNATGDGAYSTIAEQLTLPATAGTPTFSSVASTSMTVNWTAPSGGAATYKLERCTGAACSDYAEISAGIVGLSYGDTGRAPNTSYRYRVRATNATGDGAYSGTGTQLTLSGLSTAPSFNNTKATTTGITWSVPSGGADSYKLNQCSTGCTQFTGIIGAATSTRNLVGNTSYSYAVRATNGSGDGQWSATSTVLTLPNIAGTPTFSNVAVTGLTISWTAPTGGVASYKLERCTGTGCTNFTVASSSIAGLSYNDSGLTGNTVYRYRIIGVNATGIVFRRPPLNNCCTQTPQEHQHSSLITPTTLTVSWTAPTGGAASYKLERCEG